MERPQIKPVTLHHIQQPGTLRSRPQTSTSHTDGLGPGSSFGHVDRTVIHSAISTSGILMASVFIEAFRAENFLLLAKFQCVYLHVCLLFKCDREFMFLITISILFTQKKSASFSALFLSFSQALYGKKAAPSLSTYFVPTIVALYMFTSMKQLSTYSQCRSANQSSKKLSKFSKTTELPHGKLGFKPRFV